MRCYYPETFAQLTLGHRFEIVNRWGGYQGEQYGKGPDGLPVSSLYFDVYEAVEGCEWPL